MAPTSHLSLFFLLLISATATLAETSFRPRALILPVSKDSSTLQYLTHIKQRTPLVPVKLTVDLGGEFLWVDCDQGYNSSSYRPVRCSSAMCKSRIGGCAANTCFLGPSNTVTHVGTGGELRQDVLSIQSTDGLNPGRVVSVPRFPFTCAPTFLLNGLATGVTGIAGLGRSNIAFPSQFSSTFSFPRKLAICFSSSTRSNGAIFFGDGPYVLHPHVDVSKPLVYTPLIRNPVNTVSGPLGSPSEEYFIGVKSIKINGNKVPLNTSLLSINKEGHGGTKISTVNPYTVMETSIYDAFTKAFIKELGNVPRVVAVAPFEVCYSSKSIGGTRVGPAVPPIDLVLQSNSVYWRIFGANSMVQVSESVMCLGFVDGGLERVTSIVIGGHQLEDNLLQFDLAASRVGFSSSLLLRQTTCANFNFTSNS